MLLYVWVFYAVLANPCSSRELHLTTSDQGYMTVIQGFAARLECVLNTCVRHAATVIWFKDDVPIYNATRFLESSGVDPNSVLLQHNIEIDKEHDCTGTCSDSEYCIDGSQCVDNECCTCSSEDFTLVLKNLTFDDAGRYRCQISNQPQLLEFQLEVLESGLKGGFHENISYDYSECCAKKGISPLCKAMCKPRDMHVHYFDPTSCKTDDYKNFLSCATEGGNRSHVQCCKTQLVPSFCYDFCSGNFQMLLKPHRLCLYYLPEIFECYNRAYLPFPEHPLDLTVNAIGSDELRICWQPPQPQSSNKHLDINYYTVYYKQIPSFPFLGGDDGIPLLSGDYEESIPGGIAEEEIADGTTLKRGKRQTWLFVTHDSSTNDSTVREFKFDEVNTTDTCLTLKDLRSATRYIVYVTASNDFGMSVPSSRALAATNAIVSPSNMTLPQIEQCCSSNGVSPYCASKMCDVRTVPTALDIIAISTSCRTEWSKVSPCLADGRNHTDCCLRKGVQHDCLKICGGAAEPLTMHSLLCLNLDIAAIYQCLRQGYVTRPSAPQNVTVSAVTEDSVEVEWTEPVANSHLVDSFSLYIWKDEDRFELFKEVHNVTSPHIEYGLDAGTEYTLYVKSHGPDGDSLMSTAQVFLTKPVVQNYCPHGEPLFHPNGFRYYCAGMTHDCPPMYECIVRGSSETDAFCCSKTTAGYSSKDCCSQRGVSESCVPHCSNQSSPLNSECAEYRDIWVQCMSGGMDHTTCCIESGLPDPCLTACAHPFTLPKECLRYAGLLANCYLLLNSELPIAVTNVQVLSRNSSSVKLVWDVPEHSVDIYQVQLFTGDRVFKQDNVSANSIQFDGLEPNNNYTARVIAFNSHGSSPPSLNVSFETLTEPEPGNKPMAPVKLHAVWNHGKKVNITWDWTPLQHNGELVTKRPVFVVNYANVGNQTLWTTAETQNMWYIMENLTVDASYEVYVYTKVDNNRSPTSALITLIAQSDEYDLPEPTITITPESPVQTYSKGQQVEVKCSVLFDRDVNIVLQIGQMIVQTQTPMKSLKTQVIVDEKNSSITCTIMDSSGRQSRSQTHIDVMFGPEVKMYLDWVYSHEDVPAEIKCTVNSFPEPQMTWYWSDTPVNDTVFTKKIGLNQYQYTLYIKNTTGREGVYTCKARGANGVEKNATGQLIVVKAYLPLTPRMVLKCCVESKMSEKCSRACSVYPEFEGDCSEYAEDYVRCAYDGGDHRICCLLARVPSRCVGMCRSGQGYNTSDCAKYAARAVACMIEGHEHAPSPPRHVHYESTGEDSVKVTWNDVDKSEYKMFAIYYRPENDNGDYRVVKTINLEAELNGLDPNLNYDMAVVAANGIGHSAFVETQILSSERSRSRKGTSFFSAFFLSFMFVAAVSCTIYIIRTNAWPKILQKLHQHPLSDRDPTVAFENPGYDTEVQIHGLSRSDASTNDWQNADLEVVAPDSNATETSNGMRYAKLNSS